jgi:MFS family permease
VFGSAALVLAAVSFLVLRNRPADRGLTALGASETAAPPADRAGGLQWGLVYRAGAVWHLGLVYLAFGFSYIIYITFFVKRLVAEGSYTAAGAGQLLSVVGWISLVCGLLWGIVSDLIGRKRTLVIVYLIQAASFGLFALPTASATALVSALLFGLTAWSIPAIMAAACGDVVGPRLSPAALGFVTLFFGIGQAAGPAVAGAIADAAGSFAPAFLLAAGVALAGAVGAGLKAGRQ